MIARFVPGVPWKGSPGAHEQQRHRPANSHHRNYDVVPHPITLHLPDRPAAHIETSDAPDIGSANDAPDGPGFGDPNGLLLNPGAPGGERPMPPPPPQDTEKQIRKPKVVPADVQQALLMTRVEPVYPVLAKQIHLEGTVVIRAIIAKDGSVGSAEILSGHPWLARAARDAIVQWRYRPTLLRGEPIEVETLVTVIFKMH
jgi:periplasmic protein TonB